MKSIEKPNISKLDFKISDFFALTESSNNACVSKSCIKNGEKFKVINKLSGDIEIYYACDLGQETLAFSEEGKVYISNKGVFLLATRISSGKRKVVEFDHNENPSVLMIGEEDAFFFNGKTLWQSYVPFCQCATRLGNLFFIGVDNKIMFDNVDNLKFSYAFNPLNLIILPKHAGNAVGLVSHEKELIAICQKAIIKISPFGDAIDYKVEVISTPSLDVKYNSVKKVGNKICFINGDKLCCLNNGTLKEVKTIADFKGAEVLYCGATGTKYIIEYVFNGAQENMVTVVDVENQAESTFIGDITSVADGGVFVINGQVCRLDELGNIGGDCSWESKEFDLNKPNEKTLTSLSVRVNGEVDVVLNTDCGQKTFRFSKGYVTKNTNLRTKTFKIKVQAKGDFNLDSLTISYY